MVPSPHPRLPIGISDFRKPVNLSTLRYFLEPSKEDRTAMFEGLAVARSEAAKPHFQRHPVIWLTFKDVKAQRFDAAFAAIRSELSRAYGEHAYLLKEGALDPWDAARFEIAAVLDAKQVQVKVAPPR